MVSRANLVLIFSEMEVEVVSQPAVSEGKVSKNVESMQQKFDNELKNGTWASDGRGSSSFFSFMKIVN